MTERLVQDAGGGQREPKTVTLDADLVVVGGGMAGTCAAITAAREGLQVVLMQDRPVLGGNGSSEIRLWLLGATCHMGSNGRWAREGGVINEIMLENLYRNREGNPVLVDPILLEKVVAEPNITLLLNTSANAVERAQDDSGRIASVSGYCSQNSTRYVCRAPFFCDSSGDGVLGFLSGAAFRMGAEAREEFDEGFAPDEAFGGLLGHSIYFYTRDTGQPIPFVAPAFALENVPDRIPRYKAFNTKTDGCKLWWIEYGGRLDTVHDTEDIKWELWKVVYGVWDYIKNSGEFPDAENLTLDWVGMIPGKRESRRFEGDYILTQKDILERRVHEDDVAHGGWSIDLHPADGVYAEIAGAHHLHSKGIYTIPFRCYYSRNVSNLFLAGRLISASHVAFGTTRVMCTCALGGQAIAVAAAVCKAEGVQPRELVGTPAFDEVRLRLQRAGQHIPGVPLHDPDDLTHTATCSASSIWRPTALPADVAPTPAAHGLAQILPLPAGALPTVTFFADLEMPADVTVRVATTSDARHFTPDRDLGTKVLSLQAGKRVPVPLTFDVTLDAPAYVYFIVESCPEVLLHRSSQRATGLLALEKGQKDADFTAVGGERFEWWRPRRRPAGQNLALTCEPALQSFEPEQVKNGFHRPTHRANAWVADPVDERPTLTLSWPSPQRIARIELWFDPDYDHPLETVLWGHPERMVPFMARDISVTTGEGAALAELKDNRETRRVIELDPPVETGRLDIAVTGTHGAPAAIFDMRCYSR